MLISLTPVSTYVGHLQYTPVGHFNALPRYLLPLYMCLRTVLPICVLCLFVQNCLLLQLCPDPIIQAAGQWPVGVSYQYQCTVSVASLVARGTSPLFYSPCILPQLLMFMYVALCTLTQPVEHTLLPVHVFLLHTLTETFNGQSTYICFQCV